MYVAAPPAAGSCCSKPFGAFRRQTRRDQNRREVPRHEGFVGSPADELHRALVSVHDIGWQVAGKLLAAKRPKLLPILDNEVNNYLKSPRELI